MGKQTSIFKNTYSVFTEKKSRTVNCSIEGFDDLSLLKMTAQDTPNTQIEFALSSDTYILDFGEKLSPLTISGLIPLSAGCGDINILRSRLVSLYKKHRLGKKPVGVAIGSDAYSAYVTGKSVAISAEQPEFINFSISLLGYRKGRGKSSDKDSSSGDVGSTSDIIGSSFTDPLKKATGGSGGTGSSRDLVQGGGGVTRSDRRALSRMRDYALYAPSSEGTRPTF